MTKRSRLLQPISMLALAVSLAAALPAPVSAASSFDGSWRVQIRAENGDCRNYTVPIQVRNGRVSYAGLFNAQASGQVRSNGGVSVSFAHSAEVVNARGSLQGAAGSGSWMSPTKSCAGTWVARKS